MDIKEKVSDYISKASDIFSNCYKTFDSKIEFLKNVDNNNSYAFTCENKDEILEAVRLLGENAKEQNSRREQQAYLAELVKMFMSNPGKDQLITYFQGNEILFNVFCLMFVHFGQEATSEKEKQAHEFLVGPLNACVKKLIA